LLDAFKPDFGIVLFGADSVISDPLTHLRLTNNSLAEAAQDLKKRFSRWVGFGAGGYNLEATARTWALIWAVITDQDSEVDMSMMGGGAFLGSSELGVGSFRDLHSYSSGPEKKGHIRSKTGRKVYQAGSTSVGGGRQMSQDWLATYHSKLMSAEAAIQQIRPGSHIFVGTACGEPRR